MTHRNGAVGARVSRPWPPLVWAAATALALAVALHGGPAGAQTLNAGGDIVSEGSGKYGEVLTNLGDVSAEIGNGVNVGSVGGQMTTASASSVNVGGNRGINQVTANTGVANVANSVAVNAKVQY